MICHAKLLLLLAALCAHGSLSIMANASYSEKMKESMRETMPLYALFNNSNILNASLCRDQLDQLHAAVDDNILWGMRLLDVSGRPNSGFTYGNNFWPGSRLGCVYINEKRTIPVSTQKIINATRFRKPEEEYPPFPVQYYVTRFTHNSTQQYHIGLVGQEHMMLGMCLPSSCTVDDIKQIMERIFYNRTLLIGHLYSMDFKLIKVSDLSDDHSWLYSGQKIIAIMLLMLSLGLVVAGTLYDVMVYQKRLQKKKNFLTFENNNTADLKNDVEAKHEPEPENVSLEDHKPETTMGNVLLCFSATTNAKQIFNCDTGPDSVPALHGIKVLSMMWIIFVHNAYYSNNTLTNASLGMMYSDTLVNQIISNATYSVDTFFCISGFLMGAIYLKVMRQQKRTLSFGLYAMQFVLQTIKRLIRLTPTYLVVIMIAILNYGYHDKTSSFRMFEDPNYHCAKYWWRNVFYINNFYPWEELCLTWSWYISNDMQFFMYGTILLMLYSWRSYVALGLSAATILFGITMNAYTAYVLDYVPTVDGIHMTLSQLYAIPWLRIGPFIVGIITAVILDKLNYKLNLSTKAKIIGWSLAVVCNCSILFGGVERNMPMPINILYACLSRTLWGVGIAWLIAMCTTNNGGVVNSILSLRFWVPFSRLTFCAYLTNPLLISSIYLLNYHPETFDIMAMGTACMGFIVITYMVSSILSIVAEAPAINLLRMLSSQARMK